MNDDNLPRRSFIKGIGAAAAGLTLNGVFPAAAGADTPPSAAGGGVPRRKFGRANEEVSIIGIGGHTLATAPTEAESTRIVHEAIDAGVNFMDNAWEYHNGRGEEVMGRALKGQRDRVFLATKVCTHGKGRAVAMQMLEDSLRRLQTDRLDLWSIHAIASDAEVASAFAPGGVVEALDEARKQGKTRYVGFTGHTSPKFHLAMLTHGYHFDAVLMPMNVFEAERRGFRTEVLPQLNQQGIAALGMKSMGGDARVVREGKLTAEQALRFALSLPMTSLMVGMKSLDNLRANLKTVQNFQPMSPSEQEDLKKRFAALPQSADYYCQYRHPAYRDGFFV
jgi:aryl-alcohol dehydrogenase-like predicted oxidoreductase